MGFLGRLFGLSVFHLKTTFKTLLNKQGNDQQIVVDTEKWADIYKQKVLKVRFLSKVVLTITLLLNLSIFRSRPSEII